MCYRPNDELNQLSEWLARCINFLNFIQSELIFIGLAYSSMNIFHDPCMPAGRNYFALFVTFLCDFIVEIKPKNL